MVFASPLIKSARIVAIEFGMWRSGRKGGSSGSWLCENALLDLIFAYMISV